MPRGSSILSTIARVSFMRGVSTSSACALPMASANAATQAAAATVRQIPAGVFSMPSSPSRLLQEALAGDMVRAGGSRPQNVGMSCGSTYVKLLGSNTSL